MNNREWLYILDVADLSDWFDAEHVETEERALDGDTAALEAEYGKGGLVGGSFIDIPEQGEVVMPLESWREYLGTESENEDSRDKLEADVLHHVEDIRNKSGWTGVCANYGTVIEWLDRQAAITSHQWESYHNGMMREWMAKTVELQEQVDELTAERDKLQEQLRIGWECECRLQAERELYRSKFGKCLDYADAIHALMDDEGMA